MSTLDWPIWSRCSIALTYPAISHYQRTLNEKTGPGFAAHQEKEKNDETKMGKRKAE